MESAVKVALGLAAVACLLVPVRLLGEARRVRMLGVLAVVGALAYPNFLMAHGDRFVHAWEMFHYVLGTKYFPELGYLGLYEAGFVTERALRPNEPMPTLMRDLRTGRLVSVGDAWVRQDEVLAPFRGERLASFRHDMGVILDAMPGSQFILVLRDHGYNAPPTFTFVAQLVERVVPVTPAGLRVFASLDVALLVVLFAAIGRTFGRRALFLSLIALGVGMPFRYMWNGGAFLRMDWLAATGLGICALATRRPGVAGVLFAYATMVRLFPALFAIAAAVPWVFAFRSARARRELARYALAFVTTAVLLFAAGTTVGRGLSAWTEFRQRIADHSATSLSNNIGLPPLFVVDVAYAHRGDIDARQEDPWLRYREAIESASRARRPIVLAAGLLVFALVVFSVRTREPWQAAVFGSALVFGLAAPTCYYWILLVFVPLVASTETVAALFVALLVPAWLLPFGLRGGAATHLVTSFALLLVFAHWLASSRSSPPAPDPVPGGLSPTSRP